MFEPKTQRGYLSRLLAQVRALHPRHWRGKIGERFCDTALKVSDYSKEQELGEKVKKIPEKLWERVEGEASLKHSEALVHFADEERKRIEIEIAKETVPEKVEQEKQETRLKKAEADKAAAEARLAELKLFEKLKQIGVTVSGVEIDMEGIGTPTLKIPVRKAGENFDWESLMTGAVRISKAVVLAAGRGTRMGPLTEDRPKAMLELQGRPILAHIIERLEEAGISEILLVVGYKANTVQNYFQAHPPARAKLECRLQAAQNGTGGAALLAREFVAGENFMLTFGDILVEARTYKSMFDLLAGDDAVMAVSGYALHSRLPHILWLAGPPAA